MRPIRRALELLAEARHSKRQIAHICGISRPAVDEYEFRALQAGFVWPPAPEVDDAKLETLLFPARQGATPRLPQPDWSEVHRLLRTRKEATLQVLHEEYIAQHPRGMRYSTFCQAYRRFARKQKSTLRFDFAAGEAALVDYAGRTILVEAEEPFNAQIFVAVLGGSGLVYAEATRTQQIPDWLGSHQRMFDQWDGTPRTIICDNLKSAVIRASYRGEPELQPQYRELARHYGVNILPARPKHPQDKAKVEQAVQMVGRWVLFSLRNEHFSSLGELNIAIRTLVDRLNQKPIRRLKVSRQQLFASAEQAALRPLPAARWTYAVYRLLCVNTDYHIEFESHSYSVPFDLVGEQVEVRLTSGCVDIYHRDNLIASHQRAYTPGRTTAPAHLAPNHRAYLDWQPDEALRTAASIGPSARSFLALIFSQDSHIDHQRRAWRSLERMEKEFTAPRLESACARALLAGADEMAFVRNLLRNRREALQPTGTDNVGVVMNHENLRTPNEFSLKVIRGGKTNASE
jgi:transposase